jgi:hypothetical protein
MRPEPSKLAHLVIAYYEKFREHVPESALLLDAGELAPILQDSLATGVPLDEAAWIPASPYSPRGCCIFIGGPEDITPARGPDGEWIQ